MKALDPIRIVLVRPSHPGNVGGAARALKNMGLQHLVLVAPSNYPSEDAQARAVDASDVLDRAIICTDIDQAIGSCHFVVGTTARARRIEWPALDPGECAARMIEEARRGPVALLFGQERAGLTNVELDRCHALVHIPANPAYPSLNLACAVQILTYELYRAVPQESPRASVASSEVPATEEQMRHLYAHLEIVLLRLGFLDPANPRLLLRRLRRLFNRAELDHNEVNILRGILTSIEQKLDARSRGG